ncbi:hypothetical protein GG851_02830 [Bordetella petrii]|nr:hypothetical protein [Bordetella petrii]
MRSNNSTPKAATVARQAALGVVVGGIAILATIGICVWTSRNFQTILSAATFGGSFWATAALGLCGVALFVWAVVTAAQLGTSKPTRSCARLVFSARVIGVIALVIANLAIGQTYTDFSALDVFEATAFIALRLSLVMTPLVVPFEQL